MIKVRTLLHLGADAPTLKLLTPFLSRGSLFLTHSHICPRSLALHRMQLSTHVLRSTIRSTAPLGALACHRIDHSLATCGLLACCMQLSATLQNADRAASPPTPHAPTPTRAVAAERNGARTV